MAKIKLYSGIRISLDAAKTAKVQNCKDAATEHIEVTHGLTDKKQRNIALWGSGYGLTAAEAGAFILAVKTRCDEYESTIDAAKTQKNIDAITIDYSDITP